VGVDICGCVDGWMDGRLCTSILPERLDV
jgi:hypothetical protein